MPSISRLAQHVLVCQRETGRPITVGISGYGGSGKSVLARKLVAALPGSIRMRGDDFLDPIRSHRRSDDWSGVLRDRLAREVLEPFRGARSSSFRRYDWSTGAQGNPESLPQGEILVTDLIGLFHPQALPALDVTIWCDLDLMAATERGKQRDAALGRDHVRLWDEVWVPNERDFERRFMPRSFADIVVDTR